MSDEINVDKLNEFIFKPQTVTVEIDIADLGVFAEILTKSQAWAEMNKYREELVKK